MPLDTKTSAVRAADQLKTMIFRGDFQHGEALRQDRLARELDVSRTPLRQALQLLDREGLVEHHEFCGARVRTITLDQIDDLFEMRLALEPLAFESTFEKLSKLDLARAEMALEAAEATSALSELTELNWAFHAALYTPCGRVLMLETIKRLCTTAALAEVVSHSIAVRQETSHQEHRAVLDLCRTKDMRRAVTALRHHLRNAHLDLRSRFEE